MPVVKRHATYEDVQHAPDTQVPELIDGDLIVSTRPAAPHARAETAELFAAFDGPFGGERRRRTGPTCAAHVSMLERMPTMVHLRNVPDDLHRQLESRAALAGMSLSDFLLSELRRSLERPTRQEPLARLAQRSRVNVRPSPAQAVRSEPERR